MNCRIVASDVVDGRWIDSTPLGQRHWSRLRSSLGTEYLMDMIAKEPLALMEINPKNILVASE